MPQTQTLRDSMKSPFNSRLALAGDFDLMLIKLFNFILILLICFRIGHAGVRLFHDPNKNSVLIPEAARQEDDLLTEAILPQPKPFHEYESMIAQRDIFKPAWIAQEPAVTEQVVLGPADPPATEILQNLKVVGIILDAVPQAIIEDSQTRQTYFLHKGESFKGAVIENIKQSKVELKLGGQTITLVQ